MNFSSDIKLNNFNRNVGNIPVKIEYSVFVL